MDFNFQTTRKVPDYSQILEILKQKMSLRNPIANAIDKGMEGFQKGYSTGTQIADRRDKKNAEQELFKLLNPQIPPQVPAEGPGMPVQPQGPTQTGGIMPQEEGPRPMFQPPTPPINWNSVMSAMQRSGSDITPLVAQRMKPVTEENMVSLYFSPNMDKVSMVPQEGYTKTDIPAGTLAQFYGQMQTDKKTLMADKMQEEVRGKVDTKLSKLAGLYGKLNELGAITSTDRGSLQNIGAYASSSKLGQRIARSQGTVAQSIRDQINQMRPLLINDIRQASKMGVRGLDSQKELEFYLQAATDPHRDITTNISALNTLSNAYGLGINIEMPKLEEKQKGKERVFNPVTGNVE
jgi:hypothetical protein